MHLGFKTTLLSPKRYHTQKNCTPLIGWIWTAHVSRRAGVCCGEADDKKGHVAPQFKPESPFGSCRLTGNKTTVNINRGGPWFNSAHTQKKKKTNKLRNNPISSKT